MTRLSRAVALCCILFAVAGGTAAASAGETELVVSFLPSRIRLNPKETFTSTEAQIYTAIYEGLMTYHPLTVRPVPAVASRWTISDDGRVYTFTLRESARYWNGDRVRAEHFVDTWLTLLSPDSEAAYSFLFDVIAGAEAFRTGENRDPDSVGVRVLSPGVLEVTLEQRAPHFLDILAHHSFVPVHPLMLGSDRWDRGPEVIGNGAYRIVEWTEQEMVLTRNEFHWDRRNVRIPQLRFLFQDDGETAAQAFNDGEIHWITGGVPFDRITRPQSIVVNPLFASTYFFFVADREPWSDPRVRRAMALLLPWQRIRDPEIHFAPTGNLVPAIPGYPEVVGIPAQDLDEAFELLEQAGFPEGVGLPTVAIRTPGGVENARIAGIMRDAWRDYLDLETRVEVVEFPDYFDSLSENRAFTLATISWIGDFADPLTFLQMWMSASNLNESGFANREFDDLVRSGSAQRGADRLQTLSRAERILLETAVVLPISHSPAVNIIDLNVVGGWYPNPLDIHPFRHLNFIGLTPAPGVVRFPGR